MGKSTQINQNLILILLVVLLVVGAGFVLFIFGFQEEKPHIILISIDTLRGDHVGYAGCAPENKSTTPFLDSLADDECAAKFMQTVSTSPWTLPGHYSMLTGLPNELHRMIDDRVGYNPKLTTMAQTLKAKGYATGGFYSAPYMDPHFGFERGFDIYESCMRETSMYRILEENQTMDQAEIRKLVTEKEALSHREITSKTVVQKAMSFIKMNKEKNLFLFLHLFDVHNDYIPPREFRNRYNADYQGWAVTGSPFDYRFKPDMEEKEKHLNKLIALYNGEISWVDHNLKKFFEALNTFDESILKNSIVIFTSDHGEEFYEHDHLGHRANLYDTSLKIPLLIWAPDRIQKNRVIDALTRIYDIFPSALDLAGFEIPPHIYGRSLVPLINGQRLKAEPAVSELTFVPIDGKEKKVFDKHTCFQYKNMKLISRQKRRWSHMDPVNFSGDLLEQTYELYDLKKSPDEKINIFKTDKKMADGILQEFIKEQNRIIDFYRNLYNSSPGDDVGLKEMNDSMRKKLKDLGYAGD